MQTQCRREHQSAQHDVAIPPPPLPAAANIHTMCRPATSPAEEQRRHPSHQACNSAEARTSGKCWMMFSDESSEMLITLRCGMIVS